MENNFRYKKIKVPIIIYRTLMTESQEIQIKIAQETMNYVEDSTYLGQVKSFQNSNNKEVKRRISTAWKKNSGILSLILTETEN